jgi:hypothetical protein
MNIHSKNNIVRICNSNMFFEPSFEILMFLLRFLDFIQSCFHTYKFQLILSLITSSMFESSKKF